MINAGLRWLDFQLVFRMAKYIEGVEQKIPNQNVNFSKLIYYSFACMEENLTQFLTTM